MRTLCALSVFAVVCGGCGRIAFEPLSDDPRLARVELWASAETPLGVPLSPEFAPATHAYLLGVGLAQQSVRVLATPLDATTTISIDGQPAGAGELSAAVPLALGANVITVTGEAPSGARATYTIDVSRAAQLAQDVYIKGSNTEAQDYFGWSIALSGDSLAVGALNEDSAATGLDGDQLDNTAINSGAVYVFVRTAQGWTQQAYLKASNTESADAFGIAVAISGDTLAVGAHNEDGGIGGIDGDQGNNSAAASGAVYVFARIAGVWTQQAYIKASAPGAGDLFGRALALSGDTLAVGAPQEDSGATGIGGDEASNAAQNSGAVYTFVRVGARWTQHAYIKASNTAPLASFGRSLALVGDTLVVGAPQDPAGGSDAGAVYVFERTAQSWQQSALLASGNRDAGDLFGAAVALSGNSLAVGAPGESSSASGVGGNDADNSLAASGAVYLFERAGAAWTQRAYLKAANPSMNDELGAAMQLSGDSLVVAARLEDSNATGIDGNAADNNAADSGAVYLMQRASDLWSQRAYIKASNTGTTDSFGFSLAAEGDTIAVGGQFEDSSGTGVGATQTNNEAVDSGAVYVFR